MTRVTELMAAGVNVAFGHDCVMDLRYGLGQANMLEVAARFQERDSRVLRRGDGERGEGGAP